MPASRLSPGEQRGPFMPVCMPGFAFNGWKVVLACLSPVFHTEEEGFFDVRLVCLSYGEVVIFLLVSLLCLLCFFHLCLI